MISQEMLKALLTYEPETGEFRWKVTTSNRVNSGALAGSIHSAGYRTIGINGRRYLGHRVAWFYQTGSWPAADIDHIDGDRSNNRFSNLREATRAQNNRNTGKRSCNTSGFKGVTWDPKRRRWQAQIQARGKHKNLGRFATAEEAHAAYCSASSELHGEFSRTQ